MKLYTRFLSLFSFLFLFFLFGQLAVSQDKSYDIHLKWEKPYVNPDELSSYIPSLVISGAS